MHLNHRIICVQIIRPGCDLKTKILNNKYKGLSCNAVSFSYKINWTNGNKSVRYESIMQACNKQMHLCHGPQLQRIILFSEFSSRVI